MKKTIPTLVDQATRDNIDFHLYSVGSPQTLTQASQGLGETHHCLFCALATISLKAGLSRIGSRSVSFSSQATNGQEQTFGSHKKPRTRRGFILTIVIIILSGFLSTSRSSHSKEADAEECESGGFGDRYSFCRSKLPRAIVCIPEKSTPC